MAIRESNPTSKLTFFNMIFSGEYPNVTSDICSKGGDIFSVSGNLRKEVVSDRLKSETSVQ
jgi:hypothetical protein